MTIPTASDTPSAPPRRKLWPWIVGGIATLAAIIAVIVAVQADVGVQPQTVKVSIRGNLGGSVIADGETTTTLKAYDGTDAATITAKRSVTVTVTSTGEPPWCHVEGGSGKELADKTGSKPTMTQQTMITGAGPANVVTAPTMETVTCSATLSS